MQDILREIKERYLENLKAKKVEVENQQSSLAAQKYARRHRARPTITGGFL